jgi:hypothetical protein
LASFDKLDSNKVVAIFKTNRWVASYWRHYSFCWCIELSWLAGGVFFFRFQVYNGNCAIFPIASRFNHACIPLCDYRYNLETQQLVLNTKRDISKDQEITISYGLTGYDLFYNWGFICDCGKCSVTLKGHQW